MHKKFKCPISDYRIYTSCVLKELKGADLIVTFNGRDFDIPIIINNLNFSNKHKEYLKDYIFKKDRDLLDHCLLRDINIKGGLKDIIKRLNIDCKDCKESFDKKEMHILVESNKYNYYLITKKRRSEEDIRVLPLLEEKLGLLYEPRYYADKYHKKW